MGISSGGEAEGLEQEGPPSPASTFDFPRIVTVGERQFDVGAIADVILSGTASQKTAVELAAMLYDLEKCIPRLLGRLGVIKADRDIFYRNRGKTLQVQARAGGDTGFRYTEDMAKHEVNSDPLVQQHALLLEDGRCVMTFVGRLWSILMIQFKGVDDDERERSGSWCADGGHAGGRADDHAGR